MPTCKLVVPVQRKLLPLVSEALFRAGAEGLEERPGRPPQLVTYGAGKAPLRALWLRAQALLRQALGPDALPRAELQLDADESWRTAWTEHLRPVRLTPRLWLAPTTTPPPKLGIGQKLLTFQPALAFGDGGHATTRMAARAIEAHFREAPGGALLDIGAGNGVLSLVALASGAERALGTELDPEALAAARRNASLNGVGKRARFVPSSARVRGSFELAVANIELRPLLEVLSALPAPARRAPRLLVTGFLSNQQPAVAEALKAAGFRARRLARGGARGATESDWVLLEGRREG